MSDYPADPSTQPDPALYAALAATEGMVEWLEVSDLDKRARILRAALDAATDYLQEYL